MGNTIDVTPSPFSKTLQVPTSKSYANRLLVLAALEPKGTVIENLPESTDVVSMLDAFKHIGIKVEKLENERYFIQGPFPIVEDTVGKKPIYLETGDGGTTNRFLMPLLARGLRQYRLRASLHMQARPMQELETTLAQMGVQIRKGGSGDDFWYEIQGPMVAIPKEMKIDSSRSTQFASGLCLALADCSTTVVADSLVASESYFSLTQDLVFKFRSRKVNYRVPVDFSSLSYPLALALLNGEAHVLNCFERDLFQADSLFLPLLETLGAKMSFDKNGLHFKGVRRYSGFDFDCAPCPDLTPTLAFVAAHADGQSQLKNLGVLHYKESDRVREIIEILKAFRCEYVYNSQEEILTIEGRKAPFLAANIMPPPDHRIIMMAYLFMRANQGGTLNNVQHVAKSFPRFFEIMGA
ncbi:MAG: hypothetical protein A2X86_09895 [Bdellovibrionales bacterium GWA2_49_15]|nr:MAG: hypothetical protein A2X86_09895 [Bdellovibrionales bacterium GWA2_49_15]HAZ13095.1 hypothetical protein [Bdellovibrionales bacterium]